MLVLCILVHLDQLTLARHRLDVTPLHQVFDGYRCAACKWLGVESELTYYVCLSYLPNVTAYRIGVATL